eukprot:21231-Heterococcus_DN1.PRE.13
MARYAQQYVSASRSGYLIVLKTQNAAAVRSNRRATVVAAHKNRQVKAGNTGSTVCSSVENAQEAANTHNVSLKSQYSSYKAKEGSMLARTLTDAEPFAV